MRIRTISYEQFLPKPLEEVFAFFSNARNLEVLSPPWLKFEILTPPPIAMQAGTLLDYRICWHRLALRWRTAIDAWEPPFRFVDRQIRGPYRQWVHEHAFASVENGTLMRDRVAYAVPGWLLEPLVNRWIVGPDIARIFDYRSKKMHELFG